MSLKRCVEKSRNAIHLALINTDFTPVKEAKKKSVSVLPLKDAAIYKYGFEN
jgi:hypothetical protein